MAVDFGACVDADFVRLGVPVVGEFPVLLAPESIRVVVGARVEEEEVWLRGRSGSVRKEWLISIS